MRIICDQKMMMRFGELDVGDVFQANIRGSKGQFLKIKDYYECTHEDSSPINVVNLDEFDISSFPDDLPVKKIHADLVIE